MPVALRPLSEGKGYLRKHHDTERVVTIIKAAEMLKVSLGDSIHDDHPSLIRNYKRLRSVTCRTGNRVDFGLLLYAVA